MLQYFVHYLGSQFLGILLDELVEHLVRGRKQSFVLLSHDVLNVPSDCEALGVNTGGLGTGLFVQVRLRGQRQVVLHLTARDILLHLQLRVSLVMVQEILDVDVQQILLVYLLVQREDYVLP